MYQNEATCFYHSDPQFKTKKLLVSLKFDILIRLQFNVKTFNIPYMCTKLVEEKCLVICSLVLHSPISLCFLAHSLVCMYSISL